ncbi:MAG: hypothetical protein ABW202_14350 [Duganella sp.]
MKSILAASIAATLLIGCGGGSDSPSSTTTAGTSPTGTGNTGGTGTAANTPVAPAAPGSVINVAAASLATASRAGLARVASGADTRVAYDVAADTGDSWRITFDRNAGTYAVAVLNTRNAQVGSSGNFTSAVAGDRVSYTAPGVALNVDQRTQVLSGSLTLGGRTVSVIGSGYAAADVSRLAGTYLFAGSVRNVSDGRDRDTLDGAVRIDGQGNLLVCDDGIFNADGACVDIAGSGTPELSQFALNRQDGVVYLRQNGANVGVLHTLASERGVALLIDGAGFNRSDRVQRAGTLAAVTPQALTTDVYGTYACAAQGAPRAELTLAGTSAQVRRLFNNTSRTELAWYNRAIDDDRLFNQDGLLSLTPTASLDDDSIVLPIASGLAVMIDDADDDQLTTCSRI